MRSTGKMSVFLFFFFHEDISPFNLGVYKLDVVTILLLA